MRTRALLLCATGTVLAACSDRPPETMAGVPASECSRAEPPPRETWRTDFRLPGYPFKIEAGDRVGLMAADGTLIAAPVYDHVLEQREMSLAIVRCGEHAGVIDLSGREVVPAVFDIIRSSEDELIEVTYYGREGFSRVRWTGTLNTEGCIVKPLARDPS